MLNQFKVILNYYKPFAKWSFGVTIMLLIINPALIAAVLTKLFLVILLWYIVSNTQAKQHLTFYKNLSISSLKLFSTLFFN